MDDTNIGNEGKLKLSNSGSQESFWDDGTPMSFQSPRRTSHAKPPQHERIPRTVTLPNLFSPRSKASKKTVNQFSSPVAVTERNLWRNDEGEESAPAWVEKKGDNKATDEGSEVVSAVVHGEEENKVSLNGQVKRSRKGRLAHKVRRAFGIAD